MKIIVYRYLDPLIATQDTSTVDLVSHWNVEIHRVYQDFSSDYLADAAIAQRNAAHRPQLHQLLRDCCQESFTHLVIRHPEELGDSVQAVSDRLAELQALGIQVIATEADTTTALPLLHQIETEQRSRKIRQGHARNRLKALPPPGKAPYGYRRGKERYVLDRMTAPLVKDFFEHFLLYGSLRGAVRHLEKYGKRISASTAHRWLTHRVYRGDLEYEDGKVLLNTHAAIISREEAAQIDRLLRRNRPLPARTASAPRSLAGLVQCQRCQSAMTISRVTRPRRKQEYLYLRPTRCLQDPKCPALNYAEVLEKTIAAICEELPRTVAATNLPPIDAIRQSLEAQIQFKQSVLDQLPALLQSGVLDVATTELRRYNLQTEISELQDKLAQLPPVKLQAIAQFASIPQFWQDLSETERRFYFREFIRQIQLRRNNNDEEWQIQLVFMF